MGTDLTAFCDSEVSRYSLAEPWVQGGWRYATDGRICVREPDAEDRKLPNVATLFENFPECTMPLPTHSGKRREEACRSCCGVGREQETCPLCEGEHYMERGCECSICDVHGKIFSTVPCRRCDGTGHELVAIELAGRLFSGRYLVLVNRAFPGARYSEKLIEQEAGFALAFACGEAQGLLMERARE